MALVNSKWRVARNIVFGGSFMVWILVALVSFDGRFFISSAIIWFVASRPFFLLEENWWVWPDLIYQAAIAVSFLLTCWALYSFSIDAGGAFIGILALGSVFLGVAYAKLSVLCDRLCWEAVHAGDPSKSVSILSDTFGSPAFPWVLSIAVLSTAIHAWSVVSFEIWFAWHSIDAVTLFCLSASIVWAFEGRGEHSPSQNT